MSEIEVLSAGTLTTVQDWPGRVGLWEVGVPPSGPMDSRSLRIGNRLLGNPEGAAGLEITLSGPRLHFASAATIAITGAPLAVTLDGSPAPQWEAFGVRAGAVLALGSIRRVGMRAYLLVAGGIGGPPTLGSRAVFAAARLGGRPLRPGDRLEVATARPRPHRLGSCPAPPFENLHTLRVVLGPHGAPEFLTHEGLSELLDASWHVHHHSDRTGIRLLGPRPRWARRDGGEAGLHPSNILDSAYSVGTVMLAGDMAVIVAVDGPSLGGFTSIAQVIRADLWRLGQLRAGDELNLRAVGHDEADRAHLASEQELTGVAPKPRRGRSARRVAFGSRQDGMHGPIVYRRAGESALLVEFGEPQVDLRSSVRAHALCEALGEADLAGLREVTPGVRSLHIQHDPDRLSASKLVLALERLEREQPHPEELSIPARIVRLPLAWRHSEAMRAVERYQSSVRADAPWCPDNIDFICRINGLRSEDEVLGIVLDASYLVLGLGDVYLGAPVAVPLDPCHRLVTTKYNPARTWTPENAVGIGGAFLCVYGIEGPGGYQLVGRTVQVWSTLETPAWRLRLFDQLRFDLVSEPELEELRAIGEGTGWQPSTEPATFSLARHLASLEGRAEEIANFTSRREQAFAREREAWAAASVTAGAAA